jgi:tripartite-type tricarboxylate transporter receptor subunit TctC
MKLSSFAALVCAICTVHVACAQDYPNRPIRLVSPYAPGGGTDYFSRLIGQKLTERLGISVVVENRPGAGGVIGSDAVAKAAPDGYTLLLASPSPMVVSPHLNKNMPYDPLKDLAPITLVASVPAIFVVHPSIPVKTVKEFIQFAKARAGELTYSSSGNGGTGHLAGALFDLRAGTKMIHVPYKGTGPATIALIAGEVSIGFAESISLTTHIKAGRLRAIAMTSLKRSPLFPELPTVAETIPGYTAGPWYGALAPAKTQADIIGRLNREIAAILRAPDVRAGMRDSGAEPGGNTPVEFAAHIKDEYERWGRVIRESAIKSD